MLLIQSHKKPYCPKVPYIFEGACAIDGVRYTNEVYNYVCYDEIISGEYDETIRELINNGVTFVGTVEFMRAIFEKAGLSWNEYIGIPRNNDTGCRKIPLSKAYEETEGGKRRMFVKPTLKNLKLFTGTILDGIIQAELKDIPTDTEVLCYPIFDGQNVSEWRVYIHNHKMVGMYNYSGDFFEVPDKEWVIDQIERNKREGSFPCAYAMDVVVLSKSNNPELRRTSSVVEYNDFWAIGNYGLDNEVYVRMLKDRFREIIKKTKN